MSNYSIFFMDLLNYFINKFPIVQEDSIYFLHLSTHMLIFMLILFIIRIDNGYKDAKKSY